MTERVRWRGVTVDARTAAMLDELARITGDVYVTPTQGSFSGGVSASAGTHDGCGAVDIIAGTPDDMRMITERARRVGFAAWLRTPAQSSWPFHVHAIAVQPGGRGDRGCLSSGAYAQVVDYFDGRNGLASRAPDDGPRTYVGVTWETYKKASNDVGHVDSIDPKVIEALAEAIANRTNMTLGDFTSSGKPKPGTEGERADARLRQIEKVVRRGTSKG